MWRTLAIALVAAASQVGGAPRAWSADVPDIERGRALYEHHCIVCHTAKLHRRPDPLPLRSDDLRFIVTLWASQQGLGWSREDIDDVVFYLDRVYYRLEK
jgi:mono/diheme cytochrome c family protein